MCFYYSVNNKKPEDIIKSGLADRNKIAKIPKKLVVNGFEKPIMPVISSRTPNDIDFYQWGLVPNTIKTIGKANDFVKQFNTLNAKSETALDSKSFGFAIENQRCLVLASGFFEWQHTKKQKIPYYISLTSESMFAFAGIWDNWTDENGQEHFTYSILTTQANELMSRIHNTKKRMPIILPYNQLATWIAPQLTSQNLKTFLQSLPSPDLKAHSIKPFLNRPTEDVNEEILEHFDYSKDDSQFTIGF